MSPISAWAAAVTANPWVSSDPKFLVMKAVNRMKRLLVSAALAGVCAGCGGSDGPRFVPAGGTVTYKGQPLANANVIFAAEDGPAATATTDDAGHFELRTGAEIGAVPGSYRVAIHAVSMESNLPPGLPDPETDPEGYATAVEEVMTNNPPSSESLIPDRYSRHDTSQLTYEVTEEGPNQFEIGLTE